MTVCKCDICGKEISNESCGHLELWREDCIRFYEKAYDLCDECADIIMPRIGEIIYSAKKGTIIQ